MLRKNHHRLCQISLKMGVGLTCALTLTQAVEVDREELRSSFTFDIGQIQDGGIETKRDDNDFQGQMIQRTGVSMHQSVSVGDRLTVSVAIGGLFWNSNPETADAHRRLIKFGPGVGQAQAAFKLGDVQSPWGRLQIGLFPYKYNPDAKNLGEYLFRSGAYPNILTTGGWSIINSAGVLVDGLRLEARTGPITHDFLVSLERDVEPLHDVTPAYLVKGSFGAFEIQGGVAFAHLIPMRPSITTPRGPADRTTDPTIQPLNRYKGDTLVTDPNDSVYSNFTYKSTKLVGRVSINPQSFFQLGFLNPQDLKLYAEAALLGVKNYPFYYERWWTRFPVMVGFNLPTFKLLDILSFEFEYRKPEFVNSTYYSYQNAIIPVPYIGKPDFGETYADVIRNYDKNQLMEAPFKRNHGVKWSVFTKRTVIPGLAIYAQAASDHMRGIRFEGVPLDETITQTPSEWYYLIRLEVGL